MANAYGTREYEKYIEEHNKIVIGHEIVKTDKTEEHLEMNGICFDITSEDLLYQKKASPYLSCQTFYEITITLKNGQTKTYHAVDDFYKPQVFSHRGIDYIFMRKTLYGYCIIDSRNFEEYNYFPSKVLQEDEEAFISCDVYCLNDLLLIVGCYWACPYEICVLNLESKKAIRLYDYLDFKGLANYELGISPIKVYDNGFGVTSEENKQEYLLDYSSLIRRIEEDGTLDL